MLTNPVQGFSGQVGQCSQLVGWLVRWSRYAVYSDTTCYICYTKKVKMWLWHASSHFSAWQIQSLFGLYEDNNIVLQRSVFLTFINPSTLRRYGSFSGLIVLHHLELLTSANKLQEQTKLPYSQSHWGCLYLHNESCWGLSVSFMFEFTCTKTGETHLKMWPFVSAMPIFFYEVLVWPFCSISGSFQTFYTKRMYSSPTISSFLHEMLVLAWNKCCLS